jgi:hypothetical protein
MQYDIDGGNITVVVGEEARMDVPTALNYIKSGQDEIETTVNAGIDAFDLNAANKTTDYNDNASAKVTTYNNNASAKLTAYNDNATSKTGDFNDNYTIKKAAVDASADAASASATLAQQWAVKMDGKVADEDYSAKYYADLASQSAGATGANKDLSNLTAAGEARFTAKQDVISDLSTIRSGAALGDTSVQLSGAQTITGAKTFTAQPQFAPGYGIRFNTDNGSSEHYVMRSSGNPSVGLAMFLNNDTSKAAFNISPTKITIGSNTILPNSITPSASDDSTRIATTAWVNAVGNNVVHRSGDEEISGTKTFKASPAVNNSQPKFRLQSSTITKGTEPASDTELGWYNFEDNAGRSMGRLRYYYNKNKSSVIQMTAYQANSSGDSNSASIKVVYPASGNPYATAPASDVNGSIVTTKSHANNYIEFGSGYILQKGTFTYASSSGTVDVPLDKTMTTTDYAVIVMMEGTVRNDMGAVTARATNKFTFKSNQYSGTGDAMYIVFGK